MEMITIFKGFEATQAHLVFAQLEAAGLHPELANEYSASALGSPAFVGGIRVRVPENEVAEAKLIIAPIEPAS